MTASTNSVPSFTLLVAMLGLMFFNGSFQQEQLQLSPYSNAGASFIIPPTQRSPNTESMLWSNPVNILRNHLQQPNKFVRTDQVLYLPRNDDESLEEVTDGRKEVEFVDDYSTLMGRNNIQRLPSAPIGRWRSSFNQAVSHSKQSSAARISPFNYFGPISDWDEAEEEGIHGRSQQQKLAAVEDKGVELRYMFPFFQTPVLTVYSFVATKITSTSTKYCIKSLNYGGVTACGRKKRQAPEEVLLEEAIQPSTTNQVMFSLPPPDKESFATPAGRNVMLASSMSEVDDSSFQWPPPTPSNRAARLRAFYISTTTIRIPTVSIRYTTTLKTIQLVADANSNQLTCIPQGVPLCNQILHK